jgi:glucosyl-dolichyl phosphate glucuronosyltransferase
MGQPKLSVVVCTHNRAARLALCLTSLVNQTAAPDQFEVIVVDNASTDRTAECAAAVARGRANFRYVFEAQLGLSHARNRGYREARCEHVAYLDDDARAFPDFVERVLETAQGRAFACWGGVVLNEYETPRPAWLSEKFRSNAHLFAHRAEMVRLGPGESVWGSVMVFERRVLELLDGFDGAYGMRGDRRRYGEETELQDRLQAAGYAIGVDPRLRIHHLVPPQAYRLGWHWKDIYGSGYDAEIHWQDRSTLLALLRGRASHCRTIARGVFAFVWRRDYYWQNLLLDLLGPLVRDYGMLRRWAGRSFLKLREREGGG